MSTDVTKVNDQLKEQFNFDAFGLDFEKQLRLEGERLEGDGADGSSCSTSENAIRTLEEEQEMLTSSLMSLTTHFAQVQLRLRQIMEAPTDHRDDMLSGLVEFAFRGIPDASLKVDLNDQEQLSDVTSDLEKERQREMINQVKAQLEELERYAYESGAGILPQTMLVEKQKVIIDELTRRIHLNLNENDLPELSPDDLKKQVDHAVGEFLTPLKMNEQLVTQLKTQIADLERFIKYLQTDGFDKKKKAKRNPDLKCECKNAHTQEEQDDDSNSVTLNGERDRRMHGPKETLNGKAISLMDKAATMLQFFAMSQFGCTNQRFQMNAMKRTNKGNHWGDLRAQLEVDTQEVLLLVKETNKLMEEELLEQHAKQQQLQTSRKKRLSSSSSQESEKPPKYMSPELTALNAELTSTVRKRLCSSIQRLIEHGLRGETEHNSVVPFIGCFSHVKSDYDQFNDAEGNYRPMHAWELILEYYHIKRGDQYNETPARKLSQSFNLDIAPNNGQSTKQHLLGAIGTVISIHSSYKRSHNAHFKAFISMALNCHKLIHWLQLILQTKDLVRSYYTEWSYVRNTGFQDALKCLDQLTKYDFELPLDLAVRQFESITDIFI